MKKIGLFICAYVCVLIYSCDNEDLKLEDVPDTVSVKPYISSSMAQTIAFLDTCTTTVPIEQLIPIINKTPEDIFSRDSTFVATRSTTLESYSGYTSYYCLYTNAETTISEAQIANWSSVMHGDEYLLTANATHYVTAYAVLYQLIDNERYIYKSYYYGNHIGVDPDNPLNIGYNFQQFGSNIYLFTSYVYFIKPSKTSDIYISVPYGFAGPGDVLNLQWYYIAEDK